MFKQVATCDECRLASLLAKCLSINFSHIPATFRGSEHFYHLPNRRPTTQDYDYRVLCEFFLRQVELFYVNFLQLSHDTTILKRLDKPDVVFWVFRAFSAFFFG